MEITEKIKVSSLGMKHYLLFVGFATASKRYHNGTEDFIKKQIDSLLDTKFKERFSSDRKTRRKAEKDYKIKQKQMLDAHRDYGRVMQRLVNSFDDIDGVYHEELIACYINEFADSIMEVRKV